MKNITKQILDNPYMKVELGNVVFLNLLETTLKTINKNLKLRDKSFFHILIDYPVFWPHDLDLFDFIDKKILKKIKDKECYFIFDATAEGFSPFQENWFNIFYYTCEKHNVSPSQIILASSNLKDEDNIKKYCEQTNRLPINVISIPLFENACHIHENLEDQFLLSVNSSKEKFKNKYFSSLSRVNREHRAVGTFLLCQSSIKEKGLISHNKLKEKNFDFDYISSKTNYNEKDLKRWLKTLPLVVDYNDFNINWANNRKFDHIHDQTIFQIVNETLVDNYHDSSFFYSEKTFRPISCFQPFLIYGQIGCNHYLKNLGYKTYEEWFDLSFDFEEDFIKRYQKLLLVAEDTCKYLDSMTKDQQLEWKFKNKQILIHNAWTMNNQQYTHDKIKDFVLRLENQILEQSI